MKRKAYSEEINFVTLTVIDWIDVFTRRVYSDFLIDCLNYCQNEKGLEIYAYVLMTNHLHMIVKASKAPITDVLRDFKTFTSKELFKMIKENRKESKKSWMLMAFRKNGRKNKLNHFHQFWQNGSHPVALYSNNVIQQKVDYIHLNPVKAGFVDEPSKYYYSSANPSNPLGVHI